MSTQSESLESKNSSLSNTANSSTNKSTAGKKIKSQKPLFVKLSILVPASHELAYRIACVQLEAAEEPFFKYNELGREMLRRMLDWLVKNKKIDLTTIKDLISLEPTIKW